VFVVDDDVSVRESLELLIRCEGWQPQTFGSADEFLDHSRVATASCLVLDLTLPGLNGLELQERIAGDRSEMPIIFISGYGDVPKTVRAMKAGAVEFLTKPFNDNDLLSAIRQAIERSQSEPSSSKARRENSGSAWRHSLHANAKSWIWSSPAC
jgi:FixJ family two-component response regulator